MTNWDISRTLLYVSNLLLLDNKRELAKIYEKSAYSVAALDYSINRGEEVPFLPEIVRNDIDEILTTGNLSLKDSLELQFPKGVISLLRLPNISPDNVLKLYNVLGVSSISDLYRALETRKVRNIRGVGPRFEEQLRKSFLLYKRDNFELNLFEGFSYANSIKRLLLDKGIERVEITGSVRRGKEMVNNLNFVVTGEKVANIIKSNLSFKKIEKESPTNLYLKDRNNIQIKFLIVPAEYFSPALLYYTGSKLHNQKINERAKIRGYKISPRGYILIKADNEETIYKKLGLQYIPPELREGEEEIELAERNVLPQLIEYSDIKGDLHVHSNFSDGTNSINEIKEEALYYGYRYIAITDHSVSLKIANGLSTNRLMKEMDIIDKLNREKEIKILKGSEIEINNDGSLDFDNNILEKLDLRIAAMHTGFENRKSTNTFRLEKALSNKLVNILAHPTGRLLSLREGFKFDIEKVFRIASLNNVALEVNVFLKRMDLSVGLIKQAKRLGVKYFSIGTDAHNVGHLNFMRYGVKILRRVYLTKNEVINTFNFNELERFLWEKKH